MGHLGPGSPVGARLGPSWSRGPASVQSPPWEQEGEPFRWAEFQGRALVSALDTQSLFPSVTGAPLLSLQLELEKMTSSDQEWPGGNTASPRRSLSGGCCPRSVLPSLPGDLSGDVSLLDFLPEQNTGRHLTVSRRLRAWSRTHATVPVPGLLHAVPVLRRLFILPGSALCRSPLSFMSLDHLSLFTAVTGPAAGHHHFCF